MDSCLFQENLIEMKRKQLHPGFELKSPIPFSTTITITLFDVDEKIARS